MKKAVTYINPPSCCDVCKQSIDSMLFDSYLPEIGTWANVCPECFEEYGGRLGTGMGQKYVRLDDGKFIKTAG